MNTNYKLISLSISLFFALSASVSAAPGDLDMTFGNGGIVFSTIGGYSVGPGTILAQPDGKIVVGGMTYDNGDNEESFFLARYHPTGAPDASFGTNGKIIAPSFGNVYTGKDIALQPDGKIVAVGFSYVPGNGFAVHRFNANGTLDASFGTGGLVTTRVGIGFETATSVAIQQDGKIVVVGRSDQPDFHVVRYNPNGSLDTSFNGTGIVTTSFGNNSGATGAVLQPDGRIVVVGVVVTNNFGSNAFALARYNPDGSLDSGFGTGGKVIHAVSTYYDAIRDVVLQPDGKIVVTGWTNIIGATTRSAIVRYNQNGSIDTGFAANGIFRTEENFNIGNSIVLQSNGKLVAFGYAGYVTGFALARLNPDGAPDFGFGTYGRVITPNYRAVADGALQSDGKILAVAGGYMTNSIEIVRYLGDSAVSQRTKFDFDGDGRSDISVFRPSDRIWYLNQSTAGFSATQFGLSTDKITPADYDGDGRTDISVYRDGTWYWLNSSDNSFQTRQFGIASDIPVPANYYTGGSGGSELGVYRNGTWWILNLANDQVTTIQFGLASDKPLPADYDGDGRADQAVYRGSGEWHLNRSTQGYGIVHWGLATDKPVPADYDGDGKTDPAVYRDGAWYILESLQGWAEFRWGIASDIPAPADYDGDGKADAAIFRNGVWWLRQSTSGISVQNFGLMNDKPVPSAYLP